MLSRTVSVALCTHNGARFIVPQLDSILGQTAVPDEIVISDDASEDETLRLVEARLDAADASGIRVRILRNRAALGVTANFEQALSSTTGDLIALADQDDVWHPEKIERTQRVFEADADALLVLHDARMVDERGAYLGRSLFDTIRISGRERRAFAEGRAFEALLRRNVVTGACTMVTASLVRSARPFPENWVHDEWLAFVAGARNGVRLVDERLLEYRQHGANQIGAKPVTVATRMHRLQTPRRQRNARLLARAVDAEQWFGRSHESSMRIRWELAEKVRHEVLRSGLPAARLRRVAPVLQEWRIGGYRRYGLGLQDVVRDLVQPAD